MSVRTPERTGALEVVGQAFKGAMAALRRMRGRETHRPGELSYAQYGLLFGLCDGAARSSRGAGSPTSAETATPEACARIDRSRV